MARRFPVRVYGKPCGAPGDVSYVDLRSCRRCTSRWILVYFTREKKNLPFRVIYLSRNFYPASTLLHSTIFPTRISGVSKTKFEQKISADCTRNNTFECFAIELFGTVWIARLASVDQFSRKTSSDVFIVVIGFTNFTEIQKYYVSLLQRYFHVIF